MRTVVPWIVLGALTAGAAFALGAIGMPSPTLFSALVIGLVAALVRPRSELQLPSRFFFAAQAVCGVVIGAYLQSDALKALGTAWLPVLIVSAATLGISIGTGWVLARYTALDRPTATLGMIAGGASGIVTMADDLGADDRLVAFMQYLRVLVVVLLTPLTIAAFGAGGGGSAGPGTPAFATATDWLATIAIAPTAAFATRRLNIPAGMLLGPMLVSGALTLAGVDFVVPPALRETAFALIGLQVGLRFTLDTVKLLGRLVVPVLGGVAGLLIGSFLLGLILVATTDVSVRDSYLATTPGGLYAVVAIAFGADANTTFILGVQTVRLLIAVLLAPLAVRRIHRMGSARGMETIPEDPPPAEDGSPEEDDQPMGPPAELDPEEAPLPGLPEKEPPASE
jgi:membrane AbrB-like protein